MKHHLHRNVTNYGLSDTENRAVESKSVALADKARLMSRKLLVNSLRITLPPLFLLIDGLIQVLMFCMKPAAH